MKFEFKNRELSWLEFNERVLQEACDRTVPIIERIRFIGIFSNNLDEFFKVRYATIKRIAVSPQKNKKLYNYETFEDTGNDTTKHFSVKLSIDDKVIAKARDTSKKKAEEKASKRAFFMFQEDILKYQNQNS